MDPVEGKAKREQREEHTGDHGRDPEPGDRSHAEWIEREEGSAGGRQSAQVGAVAIVGDDEVPGRVPARDGGSEQAPEPAEAPRHPRGVEGSSHGPVAEGLDRRDGSSPDEQTRADQRAHAHAQGRHPQRIGAHAPPPAERKGERPARRSLLPDGRGQLARTLAEGQLGCVRVDRARHGPRDHWEGTGRNSQGCTVISNLLRCLDKHDSAGAGTVAAGARGCCSSSVACSAQPSSSG